MYIYLCLLIHFGDRRWRLEDFYHAAVFPFHCYLHFG